ncbi:hypothetical protein QJQ45_018496 [Haematococcus lacustris]|nr:hypothetical protein QJQ45_018496 [Haematococcus lacustris]
MHLGRQAAPYNQCPRCNVIRRAVLREAPSQSVRTQLRLFVDSASTTQLQLWLSTGLFHGFTCNPVILQRDGVKCNLSSISALAKAGFDMGAKEIHLQASCKPCSLYSWHANSPPPQAWGSNVTSMSSIAFDLSGIDPEKVVVKLPCTLEGVQTAGLLRDSNVRVTLTGLYAAPQVLLAQAVGAEYAAPYLGRMNDAYGGEQGKQAHGLRTLQGSHPVLACFPTGLQPQDSPAHAPCWHHTPHRAPCAHFHPVLPGNHAGFQQVLEMQRALHGCKSQCRLLVASLRDPADMTRLAAEGCDTFTFSPSLAARLFNNAYSIDAAAEFAAAAQENSGEADLKNGQLAVPLAGLTGLATKR